MEPLDTIAIEQKSLADNTLRRKRALWLLAPATLLYGVSIGFMIASLGAITELSNGNGQHLEQLQFYETLQVSLGVLMVVVNVCCAVFFIQWFRRAYANLSRLGLRLSNRDSWCVWAWFIPFYNLVAPYQMMLELFRKTNAELLDIAPDKQLPRASTISIHVWWLFWILATVWELLRIANYEEPTYYSDLYPSIMGEMASLIMILVSGLVAILMLRSYTLPERLLAANATQIQEVVRARLAAEDAEYMEWNADDTEQE